VVVVGGGAAGIMAAWNARQNGARTLLLEKTGRLGTKILISGGGKCNICHDGPLEDVLKAFRKNEALFLRPSFYRFTNVEVVQLLTERGLEVYTRPDGRIFPVHQTAKDVVGILESLLREEDVAIQTEAPVVGILPVQGGFRVDIGEPIPPNSGYRHAAQGNIESVVAKTVIVSTGGASYPNCGTTGDGWDWMRQLGHQIVTTLPALAPIYLHFTEIQTQLSGIAIRDGVLKARSQGKEIARWRGDTLLTHQGVSGPCALGISRVIAEQPQVTEVTVECDILPDVSFEQLSEEIIAIPANRTVLSYLSAFMPERLGMQLLQDSQIDEHIISRRLERKPRNRLVEAVKGWKLGPVRVVPLEKGEVTAGGVSLSEVDPKSMASQVLPGMFLCGEILDIAGPVGGYNLQAAFSTGFVAGASAAKFSAKLADHAVVAS
jgi:hypothetical protein